MKNKDEHDTVGEMNNDPDNEAVRKSQYSIKKL